MSSALFPPAKLERIDSVDSIEAYKNGGVVQVEEQEEEEQVLGSTELYDKDGNLRLVPVCEFPPPPPFTHHSRADFLETPTPNPKGLLVSCPLLPAHHILVNIKTKKKTP